MYEKGCREGRYYHGMKTSFASDFAHLTKFCFIYVCFLIVKFHERAEGCNGRLMIPTQS